MSARPHTQPPAESTDYPGVEQSTATAWVAWVLFAGIMLVLLGSFQAVVGLVALFHNGYFTAHRNGQLVAVDATTWGWIHLGLAAVALVTGLGLLLGATWARIVGTVLCVVNVIVAFGFVSVSPVWAALLILFSVITAYALVAHGGEVAEAYAER
jgi:hypothetical protein